MVPFQKLINEYHFIWAATASRYQSFAFAGSQKMGKSMWNVFHAMACTILSKMQKYHGKDGIKEHLAGATKKHK